ncbi:hypothetical protein SynMVIR181_02316 [Synechococcus sp. MVIR-18-1]|nr:hypothetical protein SynMVIR181_02316 [Synechococcus sp. MVIR-18-1]
MSLALAEALHRTVGRENLGGGRTSQSGRLLFRKDLLLACPWI